MTELPTRRRYALIKRGPGGWSFDGQRFDVVSRPPYPEPYSSAEGEYFYLPVEQRLENYDTELWQRYANGYELLDDHVIELYRYEPVPRFKELLYERAVDLLRSRYPKVAEMTMDELLENVATLYESEECIERRALLNELPIPGEFPCLDAMIGTTYYDSALGTLTISDTVEAAQVFLKRWFFFRQHGIGPFRRRRIYLCQNLLEANSCREALQRFLKFVGPDYSLCIPEDWTVPLPSSDS